MTGFAELESLPADFCSRVATVSMAKAVSISNSFSKALPAELRAELESVLRGSVQTADACSAVFGTRSFELSQAQVRGRAW